MINLTSDSFTHLCAFLAFDRVSDSTGGWANRGDMPQEGLRFRAENMGGRTARTVPEGSLAQRVI